MLSSKIKALLYELMPDSWILRSGSNREKEIYLTFDDGPNPDFTLKVLEVLERNNLKASFFVTGDYIKHNAVILKKIISGKHDVFNHSYSHWEFEELNNHEKILDIKKLDIHLPGIKKFQNIPFRPPRGKLNPVLFFRLVFSDRRIVYWSYDSMDYQQESEEFLLKRFKEKPVRNGDIILFHDDNPYTISALPKLIDTWIESGFRILPVSNIYN